MSKELWDSNGSDLQEGVFDDFMGIRKSIFYQSALEYNILSHTDDLQNLSGKKVNLLEGRVGKVDPVKQFVVLQDGAVIRYEKLLLATGGTPKIHPLIEFLDKESRSRVLTFRNVRIPLI